MYFVALLGAWTLYVVWALIVIHAATQVATWIALHRLVVACSS